MNYKKKVNTFGLLAISFVLMISALGRSVLEDVIVRRFILNL